MSDTQTVEKIDAPVVEKIDTPVVEKIGTPVVEPTVCWNPNVVTLEETEKKKEWKGFCCNCIPYPGWSRDMVNEMLWAPCSCGEHDESDEGVCGLSSSHYEFEVEDAHRKKGKMEIDNYSGCGLCGYMEGKGAAKLDNCRCLCGLLSCTKGVNDLASFFSCCVVGNGIECARGEHGGFGCALGCFGFFVGKAKRAFRAFCWESGCKTF
ncbi:Hypothetical protein HVR_LOCUS1100 [uncultured virus]|nr:Hypothetical protein HVR_LOCUS1100 [uncultured virus]